jgi:alpha-ketoglutarate-dependent taurine dioxygenase
MGLSEVLPEGPDTYWHDSAFTYQSADEAQNL